MSLPAAQHAFATTWHPFNTGWQDADIAALEAHGTSGAVEAVEGGYECGCGPWTSTRTKVFLSVPPQYAYPVSFLAEVATTVPKDNRFVLDVVFTKSGSRARWRVAYLVDYTGVPTFLHDSAVRRPARVPVPMANVGTKLAALFQSTANTGQEQAGNQWSLAGALQQEVDRYQQVIQLIAADGDSQTDLFGAHDHSVAFAYPHGDIMCGAIAAIDNVTSTPTSRMVQPADQSTWGQVLAPGTYAHATIQKTQMHDYCINETTGGAIRTISFFGGTFQMTATPA